MFTDPLACTYNSVALSLPRTGTDKSHTFYRTPDGEFSINIVNPPRDVIGPVFASVSLVRTVPDPTTADIFRRIRSIRNGFTVGYQFDSTLEQAAVDIPRLRATVLALVDSTFEGRIRTGEK